MTRQRMLNEDFWHDPRLSQLSALEKVCMLYFHTNRSTNMIGVYPFVQSQMALEVGLKEDELQKLLVKLKEYDLIKLDTQTSFVWVKTWWNHNIASQIAGQKLQPRALTQIRAIPKQWRNAYFKTLLTHIECDSLRQWFLELKKGRYSPYQAEKTKETSSSNLYLINDVNRKAGAQLPVRALSSFHTSQLYMKADTMIHEHGLPQDDSLMIIRQLQLRYEQGPQIKDYGAYISKLIKLAQKGELLGSSKETSSSYNQALQE